MRNDRGREGDEVLNCGEREKGVTDSLDLSSTDPSIR